MAGLKICCWEHFACDQEDCPARSSGGRPCWLTTGTRCRRELQGTFLHKMEHCLECEVFRANMDLDALHDTMRLLGEQLREYRAIVAARDEERDRHVAELQQALAQVRTLRGLLPICANCKKIRDRHDQWLHLETYIREHSEADFTHGLCPECAHALYPRGAQ